MSINNVNDSSPDHSRSQPRPTSFHQFLVGQQIQVSVFERVGANNYVVGIDGNRHVVSSGVSLVVGSEVIATVESAGDRLELRYVGEQAGQKRLSESLLPPLSGLSTGELLSALSGFYRISLAGSGRDQLHSLADSVNDPVRMLLSGLYLARQQVELSAENLTGLYNRQVASGVPILPAGRQATLSPSAGRLESSHDDDPVADISNAMLDTLATVVAASTEVVKRVRDEHDGDRPKQGLLDVLNQVEDGSTEHQYGQLPVLIAGKLVELDLALFTSRSGVTNGAAMKRMVMSFDTKTLGPIQIEARSVNDRLIVTLSGESTAGISALSEYEADVRELGNKLGWNIEVVTYDVAHPFGRAAREVVDHVLSANTVNRLF